MRVAGVRLPDGRAVWADARTHQISALDEAVVRLPEGELVGSVFVTPEQFIEPPQRVDAAVVEVRARALPAETCGDLPGSDLPYLGSTVRLNGIQARVMAVDPVKRTVTVTGEDGTEVTMPAAGVLEPE